MGFEVKIVIAGNFLHLLALSITEVSSDKIGFGGTFITHRVHGRFYGLDLKKEGNGRFGRPAINTKKWLHIRRPKERNLDIHVACLVNSYQGKDPGVLFRLNYSFHQHVLDSSNYFQSC